MMPDSTSPPPVGLADNDLPPARRAGPELTGLLDVHSFFSEGQGVSSPRRLVQEAEKAGFGAIALTDHLSVGGAVELHQAAAKAGLTAIVGATIPLETAAGVFPVPLLCSSRTGYQNLGHLITLCRYEGQESVTLAQLAELGQDLHLLTGGRDGFPSRLLAARRRSLLKEVLDSVRNALPKRVHIQLYFDHYPWDTRRIAALGRLAREEWLPAVAAPQIRYASREDFSLYNALVCAREGITIDTPHPSRPQNRENHIGTPLSWGSPLSWRDMPAWTAALANTTTLCGQLTFDLKPERMVPPRVFIPENETADSYLRQLCFEALPRYYEGAKLVEAQGILETELEIIGSQRFPELFLACREIADFCDKKGILCSARGSAAASIICRLLGLSRIDPLKYDVLFERFLFQGKDAAPDIDIDISSERRDEVLAWIEERYGGGSGSTFLEAMVSNRITYRTPLALQDLGRAVGLPPPLRNEVTRVLGRTWRRIPPRRLAEADEQLSEVLGDAPVKNVLYRVLERMEPGHFRHFSPHSGGVVLSDKPLSWYSPQYRSANGIRALQFDKDDVEWLGLIKLDVLSLRVLSALERTVEEVRLREKIDLDVWNLPEEPGDEKLIWDLIAGGDTMTLFQIESPGQMDLSTKLKPEDMRDLADQEALHRPGPIQVGSRQPYIARKQKKEVWVPLHDSLKPILGRTRGVLVYQEQVVRIARYVAGLSWTDADRFRKTIQKSRPDEDEVQKLRKKFIDGAVEAQGMSRDVARQIYDHCAAFTGFGFAESHSASFAKITYSTAWLLLKYPAEWLAAFFTVHPGMWPRETLRMTCKRKGVPLLHLDVNRSGPAFHVEVQEDGETRIKSIRTALTAVKGLSEELAREILWERNLRPFDGVADFLHRLQIDSDTLERLVRAGAFDTLQDRRAALYEAYALQGAARSGQSPLLVPKVDRPVLRPLSSHDRVDWDIQVMQMSGSRLHPIDALRSRLRDLGARPLTLVDRDGPVRTAGLVVGLQTPPTAHGMAFVMIEDGERLAQVVVGSDLWREHYRLLRDSKILVVEGIAQLSGATTSIRARRLLPVSGDNTAGPTAAYRRSGW